MRVKFDMANAQRNFALAVNELGKLPGFDRGKIIKAEAGSILKKCMSETKVSDIAKIEAGARLRSAKGLGLTRGGDVTINAGIKGPFGRVFVRKSGGSGYRRTHDAGFEPLNQHYANATWGKITNAISDYQNVLARILAQAKMTAGLARQSWLLIAESLGINLLSVPGGRISNSAISKAFAARGKNGRLYPNGIGKEERTKSTYFITLINRLPYGNKLGFGGILQAAIAGRVSFINQAVSKGALTSLEKTAKSFPGWKVTGGIN